MDSDWVSAYSTPKLYKAELAKLVLEDNGIDVVIMNKQDSFYLIGDIEVYVKSQDVIKAKFLLKDI